MTLPESSNFQRAIVVAIFVIILLVFFLPDRKVESSIHSNGSTYGRILVDSPEVYTRERMVNDRFHQEAWLMEQLEALSNQKPGVQGGIQSDTRTRRDANLSIGQNEGPTDASNALPVEYTESHEPEAGQPQMTPIEYFRGHQSAREEVRNAIIENQLDDRHDLGGNTLYRLKFDATVIPGNDTSAWAQINVRFKKMESSKEDQEQELKELYQRWMNDLRDQVNTTFSDQLRNIGTNYDRDPAELYKITLSRYGLSVGFTTTSELWGKQPYLEKPECRKALIVSTSEGEELFKLQGYSLERLTCLLEVAPRMLDCAPDNCRKEIVKEDVKEDVMEKVLNAFFTSLGEKELLTKELGKKNIKKSESYYGSRQKSAVKQADGSPRFVDFSAGPYSDSIRVEEYTTKSNFAVPVDLTENERTSFFNYNYPGGLITYSAVPIELNDNERQMFQKYYSKDFIDDQIILSWTSTLSCPETLVQIIVNARAFKICKRDLNQIQTSSTQEIAVDSPPSINGEVQSATNGMPLLTVLRNDEYIKENWAIIMNCQPTEQITIDEREFLICASSMEKLKSFGIGSIIENETSPIDLKIENDFDGLPQVVVNTGYLNFRAKLKTSEQNNSLFSYAVTPRESSQQLASSSSRTVAEQVGTSASGGTDGANIEAGAGRSSLFSEYAQIMERRPIIVGIASHPNEIPAKKNLDDAIQNESSAMINLVDSTQEKSAELGWLIGPKLVVGADGLTTYRHLPSQNSLSAIVSAPSWWRHAKIEIETGWLNQEGKFEKDSEISYPIALPGDQEEITSQLLRQGKRPKPSIDTVEPTVITALKRAKLLIEGQNLWRSTVVTIGSQRSKKIFVLPNMKGIIAEFDEIGIQETRPTEKGSKTKVRVWTSEGVVEWPGGINVNDSTPKK